MARMFNPPHPGLTLRDDVLPALGLAEQSAYDVWQAAGRFKAAPMHVQPAPLMTA